MSKKQVQEQETEQIFEDNFVEELTYNFMMDLRKKNINKFRRAKIIEKYMEKNHITERELAKEIGVSPSAISDWLLFNRLEYEEYEILKSKGINDKQINKILNNKSTILKELNHITDITKIDAILEGTIREIKFYGNSLQKDMISNMTDDLAHELIDQLNRLRMEIEKLRK